jgi:hypothetical protein
VLEQRRRVLKAESLWPPNMRAISARQSFAFTSRNSECVRPFATSFVTTKRVDAAATCDRCVMHNT